MSDGEVPEDRCGFVLEPDDIPEHAQDANVPPGPLSDSVQDFDRRSKEWYEASEAACCWREVWAGADDGRCIWHADSDDKPADALIDARADGPERLDGAYVPAVELGDTIDLEECRLWGAAFDGTGLQEASFADVDGSYTEFPDADLGGSQFPDANLPEAGFPDAFLLNAQFPDADLHGAQFPDANLSYAEFPDAYLPKAGFPDAYLVGAQFPYAFLRFAQFPDANLRRAQFPDADLFHAQFPDARLRRAQFPEADLLGAQFPDAVLWDTQFSDADLRYAQFSDADFLGAQFPDADLRRARFPDADLRRADLTDADATDATLTGATLKRATLTRTDLGGADLTDAHLHDAHWLDARINERTTFGDVGPDEARATRLTPPQVPPHLRRATTTAVAVADQLDYDPSHCPSTRPLHRRFRARLATLSVVQRLHKKLRPQYEAARRWWFWYRTDRDALDLAHDDLGKANTVYRTIQRLYRENSMPRRIDSYYVRARDTRRKQAIIDGDLPRWLYLAAQRWVMGYGERPWRVVATSGLVILGCAVAYPLVGGVTETTTGGGTPHYFAVPLPDVLPSWVGLPGVVETVLTSLYFSVVTFTTLGYGDLRPRTGAAQFLATFESLVGAFLLALLVYVLGRRATR